jgi:hypothetical protein
MTTQKTIENFFEEQFQNTSRFYLYKDKQLLKTGKFREYAQEQINKANKILWSVGFGLIICSYYAVISLIEYGSDPNLLDLILGLSAFLVLFVTIIHSTKEYYTIKSSMSFFIKLLDNQEVKSIS